MIRTFLFDLGNVLVHFSHEQMCEQIGALCSCTGPRIRTILFETGLQFDFERGRVSEEQLQQELCRCLELAAPLPLAELRRAGSDIFRLNEPMPPLLRELRRRGHRLVLLSNTSVSHYEFIRERFDFLPLFDDCVLSFRVGAIKPEPAIYEAALNTIGCAPHECFYTDDIAAYVERGREYGLQAEVFTTPDNLIAQLRARGIDL